VRSVLVVADDLTGANATAALFARLGLRTRTLAAGSALAGSGADVTVVTTGSRRLPPEAAAGRVTGVLAALAAHDPQLLVKRVDTTLRGPIGAELAAVLSWRRAQRDGRVAALAVPAYPAAGRATVGGIHLLDGTPLARSPAASDPANPVRASRAAELLTAGTGLTAAEVHLDVMERDDQSLAGALADALARADVTVADAATDADLDRLAAAAALVRPQFADIVAVDSGPFAAAYCDALGITARTPRSPVLVVVGSPAETTRRQLETAKRGSGARLHLAGEHLTVADLAACVIGAIDECVPVTGWHVPSPAGNADRAWAEQVPRWLAAATRQVLAARPVAGLLASGGEVAAAVLEALEARGLDVVAEVQPLVVAGRVIGGRWDRLPIVTKGGLVGDDHAVTAAIGHLHGMHEALVGTTEAREVLSS
jgi:D-threonate/D-erythronate kinase